MKGQLVMGDFGGHDRTGADPVEKSSGVMWHVCGTLILSAGLSDPRQSSSVCTLKLDGGRTYLSKPEHPGGARISA
jgi:hypothetical protein